MFCMRFTVRRRCLALYGVLCWSLRLWCAAGVSCAY